MAAQLVSQVPVGAHRVEVCRRRREMETVSHSGWDQDRRRRCHFDNGRRVAGWGRAAEIAQADPQRTGYQSEIVAVAAVHMYAAQYAGGGMNYVPLNESGFRSVALAKDFGESARSSVWGSRSKIRLCARIRKEWHSTRPS